MIAGLPWQSWLLLMAAVLPGVLLQWVKWRQHR